VVVKEEGPDHEKFFTVEVVVEDRVVGSGTGRNKKEAEQAAAEAGMAYVAATKAFRHKVDRPAAASDTD
jgi:ribonuclease-3